MGYLPKTTKNILWYNVETKKVKIAFNAKFDESMNDLLDSEIPPNVTYLTRLDQAFPVLWEDDKVSVPSFDFIHTPFHEEYDQKINVTCDAKTVQ